MIADPFPFGNPGMPITSGADDTGSGVLGDPINNTGHGALEDLIWAPFHSEHDWDIAYWAKRHNLTSSAMTELLAIPVRIHLLIHYFLTNA